MCESMRRKNRAKAKAMVAKIINSNKSGTGAVYTPQGQHSAEAQHWWPATGKPMLWELEDGH